jgi:hypothetical protein
MKLQSKQLLLERQAWTLFQCLHLQINISDSFSYKRLYHALERSYLRWSRRQSKLFNYQSGDLCRFPAVQSPDVLGQGSTN